MKYLFYLLFLCIVVSCNKGDVTPAINADKIAGSYTVYRVIYGNSTLSLPATSNGITTSVSIVVTKQTDLSVGAVIVQRANSAVSARTDLGTLDISGSDLYIGTEKIGTADGTNLTLDVIDNGVRSAFFSKR